MLLFYTDIAAQTLIAPVIKTFKKLGGTVLTTINVAPGQTSYVPEVQKAIAAKPDVIFTQTDAPTAAVLYRDFKQADNLAIPFVGTDVTGASEYLKAVTYPVAHAHLVSVYGTSVSGKAATEFTSEFNAMFKGQQPLANANYAYDAVISLALAQDAAKTSDGTKVAATMKKVTNPPGTACYTYATCKQLLTAGKKINYEGASGQQPEATTSTTTCSGPTERSMWTSRATSTRWRCSRQRPLGRRPRRTWADRVHPSAGSARAGLFCPGRPSLALRPIRAGVRIAGRRGRSAMGADSDLPAAPAREPREPPLAGIKVLDVSRVLAGPYATMVLGDLGAEVIKVERPGSGDDTREWGPPFIGPEGHQESTYFLSTNRNKRSITLDLKDPDDRELFDRMLLWADVLVENFRPGVMDRLGLTSEFLQRTNPELIVLTITGFGSTGPDRDRVAYDQILQAEAGLMSVTGNGPGEPLRVGVPIADLTAGLFGIIGVLAALHERARSGRGQRVETSLLAGQIVRFTSSRAPATCWRTRCPSPMATTTRRSRPTAASAPPTARSSWRWATRSPGIGLPSCSTSRSTSPPTSVTRTAWPTAINCRS